jgi:hypothetical protein
MRVFVASAAMAADEVNVTNVKVLPISNSNVQLEIGNIETGNISTLATFNFQLEVVQGVCPRRFPIAAIAAQGEVLRDLQRKW